MKRKTRDQDDALSLLATLLVSIALALAMAFAITAGLLGGSRTFMYLRF
jgi:hypothetical protein